MKVLISGAGIAGLTTAYWLKKYGFKPTIVERAPALLTGGYKIDVRGAALLILRRMGIYDKVAASSTDMQSARLVDKEGKILHEMSGDEFGHRVGDDLEIIRGTLCQILRELLPEEEFLFGETIQEVYQSSRGVQVRFRSNEIREFDLVIGADGIHSNLRRLVFGEEAQFLKDLGLYLAVFTLPNYLNLDRVEMQYAELGRIVAVWGAHGEPNMKACFGFSAPSSAVDLSDRSQQQQLLKKTYEGIGWEVPRFLEMMPEATDFYFDSAAQIHMDSWFQGRTVLVGDAAFCASPMSGQGISLALIGAYVLAGELAVAKGDYQKAFSSYEQELRAFVKANQELGIKAAKLMNSQETANLHSWLLNQLMRILPGRLIKFFIDRSTCRIQQAANSITLKNYASLLGIIEL